jgi:hypothetical protein
MFEKLKVVNSKSNDLAMKSKQGEEELRRRKDEKE